VEPRSSLEPSCREGSRPTTPPPRRRQVSRQPPRKRAFSGIGNQRGEKVVQVMVRTRTLTRQAESPVREVCRTSAKSRQLPFKPSRVRGSLLRAAPRERLSARMVGFERADSGNSDAVAVCPGFEPARFNAPQTHQLRRPPRTAECPDAGTTRNSDATSQLQSLLGRPQSRNWCGSCPSTVAQSLCRLATVSVGRPKCTPAPDNCLAFAHLTGATDPHPHASCHGPSLYATCRVRA
jgi:hypothetical protein